MNHFPIKRKKYKICLLLIHRRKCLRSSLRHSGPVNMPKSLFILYSNHIIYAHTPSSLHTVLFTAADLQYSLNFLSLCTFVGDFPGKNAGVGCHFLLQGIFSTQGSNLCLLHWQVASLPESSGNLIRDL